MGPPVTKRSTPWYLDLKIPSLSPPTSALFPVVTPFARKIYIAVLSVKEVKSKRNNKNPRVTSIAKIHNTNRKGL